ncbi:MAG TPA: cytochrome C oxidase subunit IV family protein [Aggregatilineales bacterium]|nr:cytochrome C oxidase subunit IV family protein [Aggregatilineales bacterium]
MSESHETHESSAPAVHRRPTEGVYFTVFLALAALTVTELLVTYLQIVKLPLLIGLMITKAWLVVQFYMHLRYDDKFLSQAILFPTIVGLAMTLILQVLVHSGVPIPIG